MLDNFASIRLEKGGHIKVDPQDAEWMRAFRWFVHEGHIKGRDAKGSFRLASRIVPFGGSRPGALRFRDGDPRNFMRSNVYRDTGHCWRCGQPHGGAALCNKCSTLCHADKVANSRGVIQRATSNPQYAHLMNLEDIAARKDFRK
jgi:hypothetical protein